MLLLHKHMLALLVHQVVAARILQPALGINLIGKRSLEQLVTGFGLGIDHTTKMGNCWEIIADPVLTDLEAAKILIRFVGGPIPRNSLKLQMGGRCRLRPLTFDRDVVLIKD